MELPELIKANEAKREILVKSKDSAQSDGDVARVLYIESELVKVDTQINQLRSVLGQEPKQIDASALQPLAIQVAAIIKPDSDDLASRIAAILAPMIETLKPPPVDPVPAELKAAIVQASTLLDTITQGDGMSFFGKGLTDDKQAEVQQVQDALKKWVDQ
jgi:hypothetical protein